MLGRVGERREVVEQGELAPDQPGDEPQSRGDRRRGEHLLTLVGGQDDRVGGGIREGQRLVRQGEWLDAQAASVCRHGSPHPLGPPQRIFPFRFVKPLDFAGVERGPCVGVEPVEPETGGPDGLDGDAAAGRDGPLDVGDPRRAADVVQVEGRRWGRPRSRGAARSRRRRGRQPADRAAVATAPGSGARTASAAGHRLATERCRAETAGVPPPLDRMPPHPRTQPRQSERSSTYGCRGEVSRRWSKVVDLSEVPAHRNRTDWPGRHWAARSMSRSRTTATTG